MKNLKVTFWLLGFGCGIMLAGIVGTLLTLKVDAHMQEVNRKKNNVNNIIEESKIESPNSLESERHTEAPIDSVLNESIQTDTNNDPIINSKEESDGEHPTQPIQAKEETTESYYTIYIPSTSSASDICILLEKAGIVESGEDFLSYIKVHKKQTQLRHGTQNLPKHTDYETLLTLLLM